MDEEKRIKSFFWPVRMEDVETLDDGRMVVTLNFPSSRWVPANKTSALRWLLKHENAAGLREYDGLYLVAKFNIGMTWVERYAEVEEYQKCQRIGWSLRLSRI